MLLGWTVFGVAVRGFQMCLRQAPILHAPEGYVYSAAFTTGIGYLFESWVENNDRLLELRLAKLQKLREVEAAN